MRKVYLIKNCGILILLGLLIAVGIAWALPLETSVASNEKPLIIITVDKLNSLELFNCNFPTIRHLMAVGACGLMNIRSSAGYNNSASGYLSFGAGSRATAPGLTTGALNAEQSLTGGKAGSYINWSLGIPLTTRIDKSLLVPDIGWILNQARNEDHPVTPGRLGTLFQLHGWRTCLIGNEDNEEGLNRPGGLLLINQQGLIDEGNISASLTQNDPNFPYLYRANIARIIAELRARLTTKKLIVIDFGDFARLDLFKEEIDPVRYAGLKQLTWKRFNLLVANVLGLGAPQRFNLVIISPSISKKGMNIKNLLTPVIIYSQDYPPGILESGTTRWPGLVANIDLLPTLAKMARFDVSNSSFAGKTMKSITGSGNNVKLALLNKRLIMLTANQRSMIDWYLGIITFCWLVGCLGLYFKKTSFSGWLFNGVAVVPLALIILPLFPASCWQFPCFLGLTIMLTAGMSVFKTADERILILSGLIWMFIIGDQILGWHLIRFSALGYNAMAGSRYYGLGNEYLGVFLAVTLLFTELLSRKTSYRWPTPIILGLSIFILSWPQFGAKFGGILAGTAGFAYYLVKFYHWQLKNSKVWFSFLGCCLVLAAISWWDSLRPSDSQTHIGSFLHLFWSKDFGQVGQIIIRKITMKLKLTVSSPWIRILLLALALGMLHRWLKAKKLIQQEDLLVWQAILASGITAWLVNDAGIVAFATCISFAFSFILLKYEPGQLRPLARISQ